MRARTRGGAIVRDRLPEQVFVDRAENFLGQFHRPGLGSAQIVNINSCHISLVWRGRPRPRPLTLLLTLPLTLTYRSLTPSSKLASLPSTDPPSPTPRTPGPLAAPSSPCSSPCIRRS